MLNQIKLWKLRPPLVNDQSEFYVVGIGASAVGLEALEQFFSNMPQKYQDCVYVIPPNKSMSILNNKLHLFDPAGARGLRLPIDIFFRSLIEPDGYRVTATIREMVAFARQNVTKDPPFTRLDILFCRNMLIYLEPVLQEKMISLFNYSLKPNGILVPGTAETINHNTDFKETNDKLKIFIKASVPGITGLKDLPVSFGYRIAEATESYSSSKITKSGSSRKMKEKDGLLQRRHEELPSLRVEIQSSHEELQSTIEEQQSTNEELQNVNKELQIETADGRTINVEFVSNVYLFVHIKVIQCFIREINH